MIRFNILYIIIILLLIGCSKNNEDNKYAAIENASGYYGKFVYDSHVYNISCVNATNLIDIKEELQTLNSNIVELLNKIHDSRSN